MSVAFLLPFVVVGALVVWLLVALTRSALRDSRRLRSPAVAATGWQRLSIAARLVPAAFFGLIALLVVLSQVVDTSQESHAKTAYQQALHRKELRQQAKVARRYILDDSEVISPNPAGYTAANGWKLADTLRQTTDWASHGRTPRAELWLRPDGTFTYYSTITGDEAGGQAIGRWQLHGDDWEDPGTMAGLKKMRRYNVAFEFLLPIVGEPAPLSGTVQNEVGIATATLYGSYIREGKQLRFALKEAPLPLAQLAQQPPQMVLAFSPF